LRTISNFIITGSIDSKNTGLFAIFLRRTMETQLNTLIYSLFNHMTWLISQGSRKFISLHTEESVETTNKMQPCNRIYYSKIYRRLDMFRAAYRSSSAVPNCICSPWFIYTCSDRPLSRLGGNCSSHPTWTTRGCKYSLELLMMSGMPLDTYWAFNKLWNNKFYYKVASRWLFLLIHTTTHESMNTKFTFECLFLGWINFVMSERHKLWNKAIPH
jgi:hypothetical protein